ncbi:MAG: response regulator [Thermoanaerobaculia bacterium]
MRVLLVDDDENILFAVTRGLQSEGFRVESVTEGRKAVGMIQRRRPDVVLLDITLKDISGVVLASMIRKSWPDLPIIFATGHHRYDGLEAMQATPRTETLRKPYPMSELIAKIARVTCSGESRGEQRGERRA